jgi:hypothetical protein
MIVQVTPEPRSTLIRDPWFVPFLLSFLFANKAVAYKSRLLALPKIGTRLKRLARENTVVAFFVAFMYA